MLKIFISYRRSDSAYAAGHLCTQLKAHFGADHVFMDVDDIPLGIDFRQHLKTVIAQCHIILVIIGDQWLNCRTEHGQRRLDNPDDFVRIEIESALLSDKIIIPVLVKNAVMPEEKELPQPLGPLAFRNGTLIRSGHDLNNDTQRLIDSLKRLAQDRGLVVTSTTNTESNDTTESPSHHRTPPVHKFDRYLAAPWFGWLWLPLSVVVFMLTMIVVILLSTPWTDNYQTHFGLLAVISALAVLKLGLKLESRQQSLTQGKPSRIFRRSALFYLWFALFGLFDDINVHWFGQSAPVLEALLVTSVLSVWLKIRWPLH